MRLIAFEVLVLAQLSHKSKVLPYKIVTRETN